MITDFLLQLGIAKKEAEVYLKLLQVGANRASTLAYQLSLPRTTVQNILLRLEQEKLVTRTIEKNVYIFQPVHPNNLLRLIEIKKREAASLFDTMADHLQKIIPQMLSTMHSRKYMPSVLFYQGKDAVRKVLFDTLTSKTELKGFVNPVAMFTLVKDINDEYVAEREKTKITKRGLLLDTPFARKIYESGEYSPKSYKGFKWIDPDKYPFDLEMNIYDGKISYITYVENDFVGVIIENEHIYKMHESMWNLIWDSLPTHS